MRREGTDVTLVSYAKTVAHCLQAAEHAGGARHLGRGDRPAHAQAARRGDDPRARCARPAALIVVHEASGTVRRRRRDRGAARREGLRALKAPVVRITGPDAPRLRAGFSSRQRCRRPRRSRRGRCSSSTSRPWRRSGPGGRGAARARRASGPLGQAPRTADRPRRHGRASPVPSSSVLHFKAMKAGKEKAPNDWRDRDVVETPVGPEPGKHPVQHAEQQHCQRFLQGRLLHVRAYDCNGVCKGLDDVTLLVEDLVAVDIFQEPNVLGQDAMRILCVRVLDEKTLDEDRQPLHRPYRRHHGPNRTAPPSARHARRRC